MSTFALVCALFASALGGFVTLSLAMDRHYEDAHGRGRTPGPSRPWQQLGGAALLGLSLVAAPPSCCQGRTPGPSRPWQQLGGAALLGLSLVAALRLRGLAMGWVLWLGALTAAALVVVGLVSYRPGWARRVGAVASVLGVATAAAYGLLLLP